MYSSAAYTTAGYVSQYKLCPVFLSSRPILDGRPKIIFPPHPGNQKGKKCRRIRSLGESGSSLRSTTQPSRTRAEKAMNAKEQALSQLRESGITNNIIQEGCEQKCTFCGRPGHNRRKCESPQLLYILENTQNKLWPMVLARKRVKEGVMKDVERKGGGDDHDNNWSDIEMSASSEEETIESSEEEANESSEEEESESSEEEESASSEEEANASSEEEASDSSGEGTMDTMSGCLKKGSSKTVAWKKVVFINYFFHSNINNNDYYSDITYIFNLG